MPDDDLTRYDAEITTEEGEGMLIVEGPDGGGKSTLITMLAEFLDFEVEPRACTSENGIDPATLKDWVDRDLARPDKGRGVYDRYPLISEPIYGPLTRGRMADGFGDVEWLRGSLRRLYLFEPLVIFCLPPLEVVRSNIQSNHSMTTEHMAAVNRQAGALWHAYCYRASLEAEVLDAMVWDFTSPDRDRFFELVVDEAKGFI